MDDRLIGGLEAKNAIVTGGSRGVGRATALLLGKCGANVGIGYRSDRASANRVVGDLESLGVSAFAAGGDLRAGNVAQELFDRAFREFPSLEFAVVNAGIWPSHAQPLATMSDDQWNETVSANLTTAFLTSRLAASRLSPGGSLVLVSSTAGQRGEAYHSDYAATKAALIGLTKSLAVELADRDINVNCVAPGWIDTDMVVDVLKEGTRARAESEIPLGRIATPDDIAGPIVFLCSPLARHITGEVLNVNGGSVLCG